MTIAVNTRSLYKGQDGDFFSECLTRLTERHPRHQFIYIFDKPFDNKLSFPKNVTAIVTGPETKNPLLCQYWFNYRIPAVLRKYKADVFVSMDGICSLRTGVPQCLLLDDLSFLHHPALIKKSYLRFYKKNTPAFLVKAKTILTISGFNKTIIADNYKIPEDKMEVMYRAIPAIFKPISQEEKEAVKEVYTEGKEYFSFSAGTGPENNLINMLKAFSFFKKRQKSNMLLLIAGKTDTEFLHNLKTFKFRHEVKLLNNIPNEALAKVTAAAYAIIHPVLYEGNTSAPLRGMTCEVPVITSNTGSLPELFGKAALYVNPLDFEDIAGKMMLLFKDEDKAKELIKAGKIQAGHYQWDRAIDVLWRSIVKTGNG